MIISPYNTAAQRLSVLIIP